MITREEFLELSDFHYTGGPFRGYDCLGYVGHSMRNYITDEWVRTGASNLGWTLGELSEWMTSKLGRWAIEGHFMTAAEMHREMASTDIAALMAEAST